MSNKVYASEWLLFAKKNLGTAKLLFEANHYVDGYEGGLDAILSTKLIHIDYHENQKWWYGPFEQSDKSDRKAVKLITTRGTGA